MSKLFLALALTSVFFMFLGTFKYKGLVFNDPLTTQIGDPLVCDESSALKEAQKSTHLILVTKKDANVKIPINLGHGSGVAINASGSILTNYHVVEKAERLLVWANGGWKDATIQLSYPDKDLAILQTSLKTEPVRWFYSGQLIQGETLYAVGWPEEPKGASSVTKGIFSRLKSIDGVEFIQTDTPINPGNSGGALVNKCGLVGINTGKYNAEGVVGMNFAISSRFINSVIKKQQLWD